MHMCLVYFPKHFIIEFVLLNDNKIENKLLVLINTESNLKGQENNIDRLSMITK